MKMKYLFLIYLSIINIWSFGAFGLDKWKAAHKKWRIKEITLFMLAVLGGTPGAILGMRVFHHKTKHSKFYIGMPMILAVQIVIIVWVKYMI